VVNATPRLLYPRERDPVTTVQEAAWNPRSVWTDAENLSPPGVDSRTVQPAPPRCTDCAISARPLPGEFLKTALVVEVLGLCTYSDMYIRTYEYVVMNRLYAEGVMVK
jgi:hypothetical protein